MITENLSTLKIHKLTQAQYNRELEAGNLDETALYLTPDEEIDLSPYATVEQLNEKADFSHTHDYLPTSNGTIEGRLTVDDTGNPLVAYTNPTTSETAYTQLYQNHMAIGYTFVNSLKIDESGNIKIPTSNYGDTLPSAGSVGRIFFKKV